MSHLLSIVPYEVPNFLLHVRRKFHLANLFCQSFLSDLKAHHITLSLSCPLTKLIKRHWHLEFLELKSLAKPHSSIWTSIWIAAQRVWFRDYSLAASEPSSVQYHKTNCNLCWNYTLESWKRCRVLMKHYRRRRGMKEMSSSLAFCLCFAPRLAMTPLQEGLVAFLEGIM